MCWTFLQGPPILNRPEEVLMLDSVSCGVNEMCKILCRKANLHLNANVTAVYKDFTIPKGNPNVCVEYDGKKAYFDHVIIATQANQACRMLSASSNEELKKVLSLFRYERTKVVTHTDQSFLPADKSLWRSVNIGTKGNECLASVLMNNMVNIETEKPVLQTSNHCVDPNPSLVLASTLFERAVCNLQTPKAIEQLESLQGVNGIFVIGSFAYPGIPLLEGAVCSAMKVSHRLGYTCPWYFLDPSNTFRGKLSETYYLSAKKSKVSRLHTLHQIFNKTLLELTLYQFTVWALIFILFLWNQLPLRRLEKWSTWNKIT
jgi:predicted NAD/FAD-binding protein